MEKTDPQILYASDRVVPYSECALLAELAPETEFVAALRCMLASRDLRAEMSEKGLKFARSRRWQDTADETLEVYRRALNESCSPPIQVSDRGPSTSRSEEIVRDRQPKRLGGSTRAA